MTKYSLAFAGGFSLLCLINGLLPVKSLANSVPTNQSPSINYSDKSVTPNNQVSDKVNQLTQTAETELMIANGNQPESQNSSQTSDENAQVTSVSQLSDVQPTD